MRKEIMIITIISFIIATLSLFQTFVFARSVAPQTVYPLVRGYPPDYYWYLSLMRQGWEGNMLVTSRYTPEISQPQFVNTFFVVLGMIARVTRISLPLMYFVSQIFFGALLLIVAYWLAAQLFTDHKRRATAYIFMIAVTPWWYMEGGVIRMVGDFWSELDPLVRITYLQHHLFANALVVVVMLLVAFGFKKDKPWMLMIAGVLSAIAIWSNPAVALVLAITFIVSGGYLVRSRFIYESTFQGRFLGLTAFGIGVVVPIIVLNRLQNSVFPWTAFRDWERYMQFPIDAIGFIGVLGVAFGFAIIAIPSIINKKNLLWYMVLGWFFAPFIGLGVLQRFLPVSNTRYLQLASYIPTALLATEGLGILGRLGQVGRLWRLGKFERLVVSGVLVVFAYGSIPALWGSVAQQLRSVQKDKTKWEIAVPTHVFSTIEWLGIHGKPGSVIAAPVVVSTLIPAFTSLSTVAGHPTFTYQQEKKIVDLNRLYEAASKNEVEIILSSYNISYVWVDGERYMKLEKYLNELGYTVVEHTDGIKIFVIFSPPQ